VDGDGRLVSPKGLFALSRQSRSIELDRLCRDKAIVNFRRLEACGRNGQPPLLFLNFNTVLLDQGVAGSGFLRKQVADRHLSPRRVVIEIVESRVLEECLCVLNHDINVISRQHRTYQWVIEGMKRKLASHRPEEFSEVLERLLKNLTLIEAVYVLDGRGVMVTDTLFRDRRPAPENPLFREARRDDNLSLKDYFYLVMFTGLQRYVTDRYISWATGNLTRTISSAFRGPAGEGYVLCIDVREDDPSDQEGQGAG